MTGHKIWSNSKNVKTGRASGNEPGIAGTVTVISKFMRLKLEKKSANSGIVVTIPVFFAG